MTDELLTERRDHAIERLSSEFAHGMFEVDELERRMALVHAARTAVELDAIAPAGPLVEARRVRLVLGSIERTGPWVVPQRLAARVVMGNLVLDLREARLAPGETTIEVHVTMGHVELIVPPGVEVQVDASSFLANIEERTQRAPSGGNHPVVHVVGRVRLGNLEVSTRRSGETKRDAHRRRRAERRLARYFAR